MDNPFKKPGNPFETNNLPTISTTPEAAPLDGIFKSTLPEESKGVINEELIEKVITSKEPPQKTVRQMILEEYGGLESNVPINSPYWTMKG